MKTFFRIALAFSIFIFFAFSAHSTTKKDPRFSNGNNPKGITYVVELDASNMAGLCHSYRVIITDENGLVVDEPKTFHEEINTYVFHEMGPVSGTRIAQLEKIQNSSPYACKQAIYTIPNAVTNIFRNGATYLFDLAPEIMPANKLIP